MIITMEKLRERRACSYGKEFIDKFGETHVNWEIVRWAIGEDVVGWAFKNLFKDETIRTIALYLLDFLDQHGFNPEFNHFLHYLRNRSDYGLQILVGHIDVILCDLISYHEYKGVVITLEEAEGVLQMVVDIINDET